MKKIITLVSLAAVAGGVLLSGCSKPKKPAASPGGSGDSGMSTGADSPLDMKIKWVPGKKYAMRMEFTQGTEMRVPSQPQPVQQEVKLAQDLTYSVLKALDNGGWDLELEFESETMDVLQGGRSVMSFDSAQSQPPTGNDTMDTMTAVLQAMTGARIQYIIDASGNVEKVDDGDLMKHIAATGKPKAQTIFKQQLFNSDTLKRYGSFGDMMPNRTVNIGESWSVTKDVVSAIGTLTTATKYTFKNWEQHGDRKCARIAYTGDITSKSVSAATVGAAVEVEKGEVSGDVWFDPGLGMIADFNSDQKLTLKITTRQQTLKQQLTQKIRLKLVDVR
jgi:hypothetical protein